MKIAIIGGGFMGMVLAYKISRTRANVTVLERDSQLGGLATYHDYGPFIWDRYYHVILPNDRHLIELIEELDLGDRLRWKRTLTGYYVDSKFYSISSLKEFLLFPALSFSGKFRLGFTIFYGSRIKDWKKLEKISVSDWLIRIGGRQTYEKFWHPLLMAKLGKSYKKVSAVFIWTYIKRLFEARGSSSQKEQMGYVSGGYKTVFDRLEDLVEASNSKILLNTSVEEITCDPSGGLRLRYDDRVEHFDKVIFTAPLRVLEKVVSPEIAEISNDNKTIEYLGVICYVLITTVPLTPYYVLNIADEKVPFTGVIGMSSLVDPDQTAGYHINFFPKYLTRDDPFWNKSDMELKTIFLKGVQNLYPDLTEAEIKSSHVHKAMNVQPLQVINYSEVIPSVTTKHPDFYVLNTSQFANDTLNNNSVAKHIADFILEFKDAFQPKIKKHFHKEHG